jgi:GTPase-associated protein 1, N-terminal domain type 2/GTPase-associated protein 1, C-terminal domain/GTPase-associated protein 1, middle domain
MTGFGSLYYTDCRPGQGLLGGAGFQFQATSENVSSGVRELVQRTVLYEPPSVWMRAHRPVEQYPRSLAHVADGGRYVTAAGHYLGTEAGGMREGNQFTHAIVTDDLASYGLARPAQLWGASWWAGQPAPTTVCDPVVAEPPPGPWHARAVRDRIAENPHAERVLVALLSALQGLSDPDRIRILIVSDDAETAAVWIAAATLLLPRKDALSIGFKVYATNPHYSPHQILAVHPDWAGAVTTSGGFAVFDLVENRHATIVATERAKFWVPHFLERDPFDVVDAVEFAGVHGRAAAQRNSESQSSSANQSQPASAADRLAAMAVAVGERATTTAHAALLAQWLAAVPLQTAQLAAEAVVDAVVTGVHDAPSLRALDSAVHGRGVPAVAAAVRRALAEAEVHETYRTSGQHGTDRATLAPAEGSPADRAPVVGIIERGLASARPELLPSLLALANRFHVIPQIVNFLDSAQAFVAWWADNPDSVVDPSGWCSGAELVDLLRDELTLRLRGSRRPDTERAIYSHWWRLLWATVIDPADPLDRFVIDAGASQADSATRRQVQLAVLHRGDADPGAFAWRVVFGQRRPDATSVLHFLQGLPTGFFVSYALVGYAYQAMQDTPELSRDVLEVLRYLRPIWGPPPEYHRVIAWAAEDETLYQMISGLGELSVETARGCGRQLAEASLDLLAARLDEVIDELFRGRPTIAELVVLGAGPVVRRLLIPEFERRWKQPGSDPDMGTPEGNCAAATAFLLCGCPELDDNERNGLGGRLASAVVDMAPRRRGDIARMLPGTEKDDWWAWVGEQASHSGGGGLRARVAAMTGPWWRSGRKR